MALTITAGRREVEISRPDKELIPPNVTKADLARYYARIAEVMLPHIAGRPLNFERYPDGIEGHKIFQQHASGHFPDWIEVVEVPKEGGTVKHVVASEPATLVYLANQACITFHSWESRADELSRPDKMVFDLDPSVHRPAAIREAAVLIVDLLHEFGLRAVGDDLRIARLPRRCPAAAARRVRLRADLLARLRRGRGLAASRACSRSNSARPSAKARS